MKDNIIINEKEIIIELKGPKDTISNSPINGGLRRDITHLFNHDVRIGNNKEVKMLGTSYEEHMRIVANRLGLDEDRSLGLSTSVSMDDLSIVSKKYDQLQVKALTTAGIGFNSGRAGDPASSYENNGDFIQLGGTINIIIGINADLSQGALVRSIMIGTEAKTAAIQELLYGSNYSRGIATGSGTDGMIIYSDPESRLKLTDAGKHTKLGELIGLTVKEGVKKALENNMGLNKNKQYSLLSRLKRFGVSESKLYKHYVDIYGYISKKEFKSRYNPLDKNSQSLIKTSLLVHLLDQYDWNLIDENDVKIGYELLFSQELKVKGPNKKEFIDEIIDLHIKNILLVAE